MSEPVKGEPTRLSEIEERASKATGESWRSGPHIRETASMVYAGDYTGEGEPDLIVEIESGDHRADAAFIAHARTDVPALCKALRVALEGLACRSEGWCRGEKSGLYECVNCVRRAAVLAELANR